MSSFSIGVKGLDALQAQLDELGTELGSKALATAARKAFKPVLEAARARVPVLSGDLRDGLRLSTVKPDALGVAVGISVSAQSPHGQALKKAVKQKVAAEVGAAGLKVKQISVSHSSINELPPSRRWHFIELGTSKMAAHPFLRPALDGNASNVVETLKDELRKAIANAVRKRGGG